MILAIKENQKFGGASQQA